VSGRQGKPGAGRRRGLNPQALTGFASCQVDALKVPVAPRLPPVRTLWSAALRTVRRVVVARLFCLACGQHLRPGTKAWGKIYL